MSLLARYVGATCRFSRGISQGIVLPRWTGLETVGWPCDPDVRDIMSSGKLQDQARASLTFQRVKHPAASSRWQSYDRTPVGGVSHLPFVAPLPHPRYGQSGLKHGSELRLVNGRRVYGAGAGTICQEATDTIRQEDAGSAGV